MNCEGMFSMCDKSEEVPGIFSCRKGGRDIGWGFIMDILAKLLDLPTSDND